jgi:hypothetical protein
MFGTTSAVAIILGKSGDQRVCEQLEFIGLLIGMDGCMDAFFAM